MQTKVSNQFSSNKFAVFFFNFPEIHYQVPTAQLLDIGSENFSAPNM